MPDMTSTEKPWVEESSVDVRKAVRLLWAQRRGICYATGAFVVLGVLYALLSTPIYRATTIVSPAGGDHGLGGGSGMLSQLGGLAALAGISVDDKDARTEEALAVLNSCTFLERFIQDHGLLPRFFPPHESVVAKWWATIRGRKSTPARGCKFFTDNVLSVSRDKRTELISVMVDWKDRHEAASWAGELVARVNSEMRARAITTASQFTAFLEKEWEATPLVETREAIGQLIESEIRERMIATVTTEYAFRTVDAAMPADPDDVYRPNRPLVIIGAALGGLFLSCVVVLAWSNLKQGL